MIAAIPLVTSALSALAPGASTAASAIAGAGAVPAADSFGQVMSKVAADAMGSLKGAETLSVQGIKGTADVQTVVQSVMSAQENLQTALAVRDKAVAAFQEVSRMAI